MRAPGHLRRCDPYLRGNSWCSASSPSKASELESVDFLERRIEEASRYIKLEQLGLSPQCGFATSAAEHVAVTEDAQRAKLARVVEVARQVWGSPA
jgi:5-methyltetrahydropteroyltriglutamate--homocysteine methyltransferase